MLTKRLTKIFTQETARVKTISFHPQKPIFITGLHNGAIKAWDYQSNALMHEFMDHDGSVRAITFHPQGDFFISAGDDKVIRLWDYTKRQLSKTFKGHTDFVRALDFHPTKPWFVSSSDDQTIRVWNFMTGKCLATATGHSHYVMAVRFINEGTLISGSLDQSLRVWSCDSLLDGSKKSSFVPSVIVKQILNGHDRGINSIFVKDNFVVTGGDDREVKLWEYNGNEVVEKDSFFNHQGCITSVSYSEQCVVSGGEDGNLIVHNLERKHYEKVAVEGRFWTVVQKKNIVVGGHDSGFEIFRYDTPKIVCKSETGYFYTKDQNIFYSNLKTEKRVCDPTGALLSMHTLGNHLLLQFASHFEVYRQNKCVLKEYAEGALIKEKEELCVVVREKGGVFIKSVEGKDKRSLDIVSGNVLFGGEDYFFVRKNTGLVRYSPGGEEKTIPLGFRVENIISCESLYAFLSKNEIHLYDLDLNLVNATKEIVNIHGGFFYRDVFIYATTKHLKYIFREEGVIRSVDTEVFPFYYSEGQVLYLTNEGFESIEVDLTEIDFKKLVVEGGDVKGLIEGGKLPGLSPLSFLIKKHKGEIALPYIEDVRQRFELSLGDNKLEECLTYCRREKDHFMHKRLSVAALLGCNFEIAEECLLFLEEWNDLFMLYISTGREEKLEGLFEVSDDQTKKMIKLFQEDVTFFFPEGIKEDKYEEIKEDKDEEYEDKYEGLDDYNEDLSEEDEYKGEFNKNKESEEEESRVNSNCDEPTKYERFMKKNKEDSSLEDLPDALDFKEYDGEDSYEEKLLEDDLFLSEEEEEWASLLDVEKYKAMKIEYMEDTKEKYKKAYEMVSKGQFKEAVDLFYKLFYYSKGSHKLIREFLALYLSGLQVEMKRREVEDDVQSLQMAKYFASLNLKPSHHFLAKSNYVLVCLKKGNLKEAKRVALEIKEGGGQIIKEVSKALEIEEEEDKYELPPGKFCYDILNVSLDYKVCMYCSTANKEGSHCSLCKVGKLK